MAIQFALDGSGRPLPARNAAGFLDAEIANEGTKVILSDGEQISWTPPPVKAAVPDWSQIKSIARYFGRTGYQVYPAWLYHPTEEPRLVKDAEEASALGVMYRKSTPEENQAFGINARWDWEADSQWRPKPHAPPKFDPMNPGQGKEYVARAPSPIVAQNALLEAMIPQVAAAVAAALKSTGPAAPATIDPAQWEKFLQFQAWQKTAEAVEAIKSDDGGELEASEPVTGTNPLNALSPDEERRLYEDEGKRLGVKVDGRWSMERLRKEVALAQQSPAIQA
jgi:hypothetical protein